MNNFLPNLTAVLLIINAMIGCCHRHWQCDAEGMVTNVCVAPCGSCSYHSEDRHSDKQPPADPCKGESSCHGVCTYLPTPKTVIDASSTDSAVDFSAAIPALLDWQLVAALPWNLAPDCSGASPSLRLHLLHQIWLI
jgi:hypothetical protein